MCVATVSGRQREGRVELVALLLLLTGRWAAVQGNEIGHNLEALVGKVAAELLAREVGTLDEPLLTKWVDRIGQQVAACSPRQDFPFR
ncbi:MAG: hypothetical protein ACUVX8_12015, partial [Candidatus Zipacnadales bacterium]